MQQKHRTSMVYDIQNIIFFRGKQIKDESSKDNFIQKIQEK
jgi:hypothetical protein